MIKSSILCAGVANALGKQSNSNALLHQINSLLSGGHFFHESWAESRRYTLFTQPLMESRMRAPEIGCYERSFAKVRQREMRVNARRISLRNDSAQPLRSQRDLP